MISGSTTYPTFSIITPTFRRPDFLLRNIESVRRQTYHNYEHIIVDDGNDLSTQRIVEGLNDSRIVILRHDISKGAAASYNTGIRKSRGRLVAFLDDDDEYVPGYLEKVSEYFKSAPEDLGFVWSGIERIDNTESDTRKQIRNTVVWPSRFPDRESGLVAATSIGNGFGVCARRECIANIGLYDEALTVGADTDFMFRLSINYSFGTIPEALVRIHRHGINQLTGNEHNLERIRVKKIILDRYSHFLEKNPKVLCVHYSSYADLCYKSGLKEQGRKALLMTIKTRPFRVLTYSDLLLYETMGKNTANTYLGKVVKHIIKEA